MLWQAPIWIGTQLTHGLPFLTQSHLLHLALEPLHLQHNVAAIIINIIIIIIIIITYLLLLGANGVPLIGYLLDLDSKYVYQ